MRARPDAPETLADHLLCRAREEPERLAYRFLDDDGGVNALTYAELAARAGGVADALRQAVPRHSAVLVACPPGLEFVIALFGSWLAGMVAVPSMTPRTTRGASRLDALLASAEARAVLAVGPRVRDPRLSLLPWLAVDTLGEGRADEAPPADALALLQYTSGSTRAPRGVRLRHRHLRENCARILEAGAYDARSQLVSWLPPYHDMGLVAGLLVPLAAGCEATLLSPFSFVTRPVRWLEAITRYRATHSGAPDFAYALCARRVARDDAQRLDLASWRVAWSGAERVRAETLDQFARTFADQGFAREAFRPCYGLAEATLMVSIAGERGPRVLRVSDRALRAGRVEPPEGDDDGRALVSAGPVVHSHEARIVGEDGLPLAPGRVGEIWLRGPSIADGYHGAEQATSALFAATLPDGTGPFLRTGDLGFVADGELYVAGRAKDVVIVRGENHYPEDLEFTVQGVHPALTPAAGAAFALDCDGEERVCIVQEVEGRAHDFAALAARVAEALLAEHGLTLADLVFVAPGQVPRTSSGKVQRGRVRALYEAGALRVRHRLAADAPARASELVPLVRSVAAEVLGLSDLAPEQDLFALGVQSIALMQLAARLSRALGREVPLRLLFEATTPARLALALERPMAPARPALTCGPTRGPVALSPSQTRIWFEQALEPSSTAYHIAGKLVLRGELDCAALARAVSHVSMRHPQLHVRVHASERGLSAELREPVPLALHRVPAGVPEGALARLVMAPFDLALHGPLRIALFELGPRHHELVIVLHHIAGDGLSVDVLVDELCAAYEAARAGREFPRAVEGPSYADYARAMREAPGDEVERAVAHFARRLHGAPEELALPTDRPRPARRSAAGDVVRRALSAGLAAELDAFCRARGVTRYMVLCAVYTLLLARLGEVDELVLGTPVSGRLWPETERLVGTFVNMLPLRIAVPDGANFGALLAAVRAATLDAFEHQAAPFERIVEAVAPRRSQAHTPLFQVMFDYQALRSLRPHVAGLDVVAEPVRRGATQYDLALSVVELGSETALHLEYRTDLFEHATVERLAARYVALLEAALAAPDVEAGRLPWHLPGEREALLALGRGPEPSAPPLLLEAFAAQVRAHPERLALVADGEALTYGALARRVHGFAHRLVALGVAPGERVAVLLERGASLVVALLGVLEAGSAYVPLDPAQPAARLALMLEDAAPRLLVTDRPWLDVTAEVLRADLVHDEADHGPTRAVAADALAYLLFTSGSTGRPKAVEVDHGALANFLAAMAREPGLASAGGRLLAVTTVTFDIAALELFLPLCTGGTVELAPRALATDGVRLAARLERGDVALFQATPSTYRLLCEAGFQGHAELVLLCGGEALPRALAEFLRARCRVLFHVYGPTETTVWSTITRVEPGDGPVPLGRPLDHTQLYVLDRQGELAPFDVPGELCIGGRGVARGYRGRPELTAARFVRDPLPDAGRVYRTGDRVRVRGDGRLEFLGRADGQVKLRGYRIELGEVEAQLRALAGGAPCTVQCVADGAGERLVGYVATRAPLDEATLRAGLRARLPEYMVPAQLVRLDTLPLTPSGKLDAKALPRPERAPGAAVGVAPRTSEERLVCALFAELLGRDEVGVEDDFFELGGHSLLALRLVERLALEAGVRLALATLFEARTPEALAQAIGATRAEAPTRTAQVTELVPGEVEVLFVHAGDAREAEWYRPLALALGRPAAVATLADDAFLELGEAARLHAQALRREGLTQPLWLVGLGLGGNLAQELAVQREAAGEPVRGVAMVYSVPDARTEGTVAGLLLHALKVVARAPVANAAERARSLFALRARAARWAGAPLAQRVPALEDPVDRVALPVAYRRLDEPLWNALARHRPRACRAPLLVLHGAPNREHAYAPLSTGGVRGGLLLCSELDLANGEGYRRLSYALSRAWWGR